MSDERARMSDDFGNREANARGDESAD